MANFGVNIDEVWQQTNLIQTNPGPSKHSEYTVPIQKPSNQFKYPPQYNPQVIREGFQNQLDVPVSDPDHMTPPQAYPSPTIQPIHPPQQSSQSSPDISKLKQILSEQMEIIQNDQKEINYFKSLVQTLKRDLSNLEQRRQHELRENKKKRMMKTIWMLLTGLFLIVLLILVVQVLQKVNLLANQPLLMA
jgi:hypothetical protein